MNDLISTRNSPAIVGPTRSLGLRSAAGLKESTSRHLEIVSLLSAYRIVFREHCRDPFLHFAPDTGALVVAETNAKHLRACYSTDLRRFGQPLPSERSELLFRGGCGPKILINLKRVLGVLGFYNHMWISRPNYFRRRYLRLQPLSHSLPPPPK